MEFTKGSRSASASVIVTPVVEEPPKISCSPARVGKKRVGTKGSAGLNSNAMLNPQKLVFLTCSLKSLEPIEAYWAMYSEEG